MIAITQLKKAYEDIIYKHLRAGYIPSLHTIRTEAAEVLPEPGKPYTKVVLQHNNTLIDDTYNTQWYKIQKDLELLYGQLYTHAVLLTTGTERVATWSVMLASLIGEFSAKIAEIDSGVIQIVETFSTGDKIDGGCL